MVNGPLPPTKVNRMRMCPILAFVTAGWVLATTVAAGAARVISRRWQEGPSREGYLGAVIVTGWL